MLFRSKIDPTTKALPVNSAWYIPLIGMAFLQMILLQVVKAKLEPLAFQILVGCVAAIGLRDSMRIKKLFYGCSGLEFSLAFCISLLSFQRCV